MKHNVEKIKQLDIDVDLQSSYFILTQNGVYREYELDDLFVFFSKQFVCCLVMLKHFVWILVI